MQITFVEDGKDHIHDEHGQKHENGQITNGIAKSQRLSLQTCTHCRGHDLGCRLRYEGCGIAHGYPWLEVEKERDTGELIEVVDRLRAQRFFPSNQGIERHEIFAVVGSNVEK